VLNPAVLVTSDEILSAKLTCSRPRSRRAELTAAAQAGSPRQNDLPAGLPAYVVGNEPIMAKDQHQTQGSGQ
jgi:hypothetical protein